ncbi:hypothetical protein XF35_21130 [Streptomyces platensis subsp. clarensis]|nr:hypothetical protein [Streptomyces platensis subsp. clarensis]
MASDAVLLCSSSPFSTAWGEQRWRCRCGLPTLLRPPYGDLGERETRVASELGYRMCTWTSDTLDWDGSGSSRTASQIRAAVKDDSPADKGGGVVHPPAGDR